LVMLIAPAAPQSPRRWRPAHRDRELFQARCIHACPQRDARAL
jgi:hypothetical protein